MWYLFMIVLGGSIGIGLFVVFGLVILMVGLGGVLLVYVGIGVMVYFLMISLGEMVIYLFVLGLFFMYVMKFVDLVFGFVMGWNYWFNWVIMLVVDISMVVIVM